jgi:hypothetical protein
VIFDPRDTRLRGAFSQPPPLPTLPPDGPIEEMAARFGASWDLMRGQEQTVSRNRMVRDALQPYLDAYESETGERLANPFAPFANPFSIDPERGIMIRDDRVTPELREKYESARRNPGDRMVSRLPPLPDANGLLEQARQRARTAEEREALAAELPGTIAGGVAGFAGSMVGAMEDPPNLASMLFGAPAGAGMLRTMATEALVGAGVELTLRPAVTAWQRELGKDPGFADSAMAVATAGIGAGAFAGLFKGAGAGWRAVRPMLTREQRAAIHVSDALDTIDRRNPFELARKIRARSQRTGAAPGASFSDELRASAGDGAAFQVELDRLAREIDATVEQAPPAFKGSDDLLNEPTIERTEIGDQFVVPGAERISEREVIERRMAAQDIRGGQSGLEGLGLFDPTSRARQTDLLDAPAPPRVREPEQATFQATREWQDVPANAILPPGLHIRMDLATGRQQARLAPDPVEARSLHVKATQEAEDAINAGVKPDGPAIREIDQAFPDLELPVWEARTGKGRKTRWRGPMDIVTWARTIGGLRDDRGELKARDLQKFNRGRPGVEFAKGEVFLGRLVNNDSGLTLDDATLAAWEAGYFPGATSRPTPDDLLDAIDRTIAARGDVDRRVWSEHDDELVGRIRGRIDPDEEAFARELLGDEAVDDAIDAIHGLPVLEEPVEPEMAGLMREVAAGRFADEPDAGEPVDFEDEAEMMTLQALQDELDAGDFRVTQDTADDGKVVPIDRSARELWQETQAEAAALRDAAACMTGGATSAA